MSLANADAKSNAFNECEAGNTVTPCPLVCSTTETCPLEINIFDKNGFGRFYIVDPDQSRHLPEVVIQKGKTHKLLIKMMPENSFPCVEFMSSDPSIAEVNPKKALSDDQEITVKGLAEGQVSYIDVTCGGDVLGKVKVNVAKDFFLQVEPFRSWYGYDPNDDTSKPSFYADAEPAGIFQNFHVSVVKGSETLIYIGVPEKYVSDVSMDFSEDFEKIVSIDPIKLTEPKQKLRIKALEPGVAVIDFKYKGEHTDGFYIGDIYKGEKEYYNLKSIRILVYEPLEITVGIRLVHEENFDSSMGDMTIVKITEQLNRTFSQAGVSVNVKELPEIRVKFDFDKDGKLDIRTWENREIKAITDASDDKESDFVLLVVSNPKPAGQQGATSENIKNNKFALIFNTGVVVEDPDSEITPYPQFLHTLGGKTWTENPLPILTMAHELAHILLNKHDGQDGHISPKEKGNNLMDEWQTEYYEWHLNTQQCIDIRKEIGRRENLKSKNIKLLK